MRYFYYLERMSFVSPFVANMLNFIIFGSFDLSTKEPDTTMLCLSCVVIVGVVIVIIYAPLIAIP